MTNQDYQLEELENAAVNKSNNAKRAAVIGAGMLGTAATASAATYAIEHPTESEHEDVESLSTEELENVAQSGANQVHEPEVKPEAAKSTGVNNHPAGTKPATPTEVDDIDLSFNRTTETYDSEGNLVSTAIEGQLEGRDIRIVDVDGDHKADIMAVDINGDGVYQDDEIFELDESQQIDMNIDTRFHNVVVLNNEQPEPYNVDDKGDYAYNPDENRYSDEKADEIYRPGEENDSTDNSYAYEDDYKEDGDYYGELAENDGADEQLDDLGSDSFDLV